MLRSENNFQICKNEEYLIYVSIISLSDGTLKGQIIKIKNLEDCRDQS
jgi:hypothetical protein